MTAHVLVPTLDPRLPATLSPAILRGLLRRTLGYRGLVITDDMEMGAITRDRPPQDAALLALKAGADLVLLCHTPSLLPASLDTIRRAAASGELPARQIQRSLYRIERFRTRLFHRFPSSRERRRLFSRVGSEGHRSVADRVLQAAAPVP